MPSGSDLPSPEMPHDRGIPRAAPGPGRRLRVLFLASYFPRPRIPLTGTWALEQAKSLSAVTDLEVVCCTPWVPVILRAVPKARPWIDVPTVHQWGNVLARYYKALYYPIPPFNAWAFPDPSRQMALAWHSVRARLLRTIDRFQPDVLYCHHTAVNGYYASRIHSHTGLPYVITDHDFDELAQCERLPERRAFFEPILGHAYRHLCVSRRMEQDVRRIFPFAATETLHNGINLLSVPPQDERPPGLRDKLVIFSAGMFAACKGLPLLVAAFAQVAGRYPRAVLRIAGDGNDRLTIEGAIRSHKVQDQVLLLGRIPHPEVIREMAWCDIFALVSWNESFGIVYVEAMAAGKPIIACTDSGIADVVEDGTQGCLVEPKNVAAAAAALDRLLRSEQDRQRMGDNARSLVHERLTWNMNTQRLLQIFNACLAARL